MALHPPLPRQRGAALLALLLVLVAAASFSLISRLNAATQRAFAEQRTARAFREAKEALLGWALSNADSPGMLPWPDRNGDGNYDGDSDCSTVSFGDHLMLGRLPVRSQGSPCVQYPGLAIDPLDGAGQRLWYAVSRNLVRDYQSQRNPRVNSELASPSYAAPYPWITVRDANGHVVSDRVAFVLIAPGEALTDQDRAGAAPEPKQFLDSRAVGATTYANFDSDLDFIDAPRGDSFNDRVFYVTVEEFVAAVGQRALGEAARALRQYHSAYGRLPWLSEYADPGLAAAVPTGTAGAASAGMTLEDATKDFLARLVKAGDPVVNRTDGARGLVRTVAATTLTAELADGAINAFAAGDPYELARFNAVTPDYRGPGAAGVREGHLPVHRPRDAHDPADRGEPFRTNFTVDWKVPKDDGTNFGAAVAVSAVNLPARAVPLTPYLAALERAVQETPVTTLGAVAVTQARGLCLWTGRQAADCSGSTLPQELFSGTAGPGSGGNVLVDPARFHAGGDGVAGTADDWNFAALGVKPGDVVRNLSDGSQGVVATVDGVSGTARLSVVGLSGGGANAFSPGHAYELRVATRDLPTVAGTALHWDAGSKVLTGAEDFQALQVSEKDRLYNVNDGSMWKVEEVLGSHELKVEHSFGGSGTFQPGDSYQLYYGAKGGSQGRTLVDTSQDFPALGVRVGDVVENLKDGSVGVIEAVDLHALTVASLMGGSENKFEQGDHYVIHSGFVRARRYDFRWRYEDPAGPLGVYVHAADGEKLRDLCIGYSDCRNGVRSSAPLPALPVPAPSVSVTDTDGAGTEVGRATLTVPDNSPNPQPQGSVKLAGIHMDLEVGEELPAWFVDNRWHHELIAALAPGLAPGGSGSCTPAMDCLRLRHVDGEAGVSAVNEGVQSLLVLAGRPLAGQDRTSGALGAYFEHENASLDGLYERGPRAADFNDSVRIVLP